MFVIVQQDLIFIFVVQDSFDDDDDYDDV